MANEIQGLYFYKLDSGSTYGTDNVTLYKQLNISHIDHNFNTLLGHDISGLTFDADLCEISLSKNNGDTLTTEGLREFLSTKISGEIKDLVVAYNKDEGEITFSWTKDGEEQQFTIEGLITENNIGSNFLRNVYTNGTLVGNGTVQTPLGLNPLLKTSQFGPCKGIVDRSQYQPYPANVAVGDKYLVKDNTNIYGYLYTFDNLQTINHWLNGNGWRVPTNDDFNKIVTQIAVCSESSQDESGLHLKSKTRWKNNGSRDGNGVDTYSFNAYPVGYYTWSYEEDGTKTRFWTISENSNLAYCRTLSYASKSFSEEIVSKDYKLSVRLIKDYDGKNFSTYENILGKDYKCVLIPSDTQYGYTIVMAENLAYEGLEDSIINPSVNANVLGYKIATYNGERWISENLDDGSDVIVVTDGIYKEYRVENTELIDHDSIVQGLIDETANAINDEITEIRTNVSTISGNVENLQSEVDEHDDKITTLEDGMNDLANGLAYAITYAENALKEVDANKTGQHRPCYKLVADLPISSDVKVGDRYLVQTQINPYGYLYNFQGVNRINNNLQGGWHVPTKDDWEDMIDALPSQSSTRNLKSSSLWNGTNYNKFNILPSGCITVDNSRYLNGYGDSAFFWANGVYDKKVYAFSIATDRNVLTDDVKDQDDFYNVRLCKDYDGYNFTYNESLLGRSYKCTLMPSLTSTTKMKVWTTENVDFYINERGVYKNVASNDVVNPITPISKYIINEWDGVQWITTEMEEGETIVLFEGLNGEDYMEYMLWHGELINFIDKYVKNKKPGIEYTMYYGVSDNAYLMISDVKNLDSYKNTTREIDPVMLQCSGGKYVFYCVPTTLDDTSEEIEVYANGMLINAYIKIERAYVIDGIDYNIYRLTNQYYGRVKLQII